MKGPIGEMQEAIWPPSRLWIEGAVPWTFVDSDLLDEVIGAAYHFTERWFRPCMRVGYASKFRG